jgi:hypothetical protein
MRWIVDPGVRCDLVFYAATNLTGKRATMRIFPAGNKQGTDIGPEDLRSMVIRAPLGTRVVLARSAGEAWEDLAWRCIELTRGHVVPPASATGLPGVRIPDIDLLDEPTAKHVSRDFQASYPLAERLDAGKGWSYGRPGDLKGRVNVIRILKPEGSSDAVGRDEKLLTRLLQRVNERDPAMARGLIDDVVAVLDSADPERVRERLEGELG